MSADTLTLTSRKFYERTRSKLAASLAIGAACIFSLGMLTFTFFHFSFSRISLSLSLFFYIIFSLSLSLSISFISFAIFVSYIIVSLTLTFFFLLGMAASFGGIANSYSYYIKDATGDNEDKMNALISGYGFATFSLICASIIFFAGSIIYSPLIKGSENEKKQLKGPFEIDSGK